MATEITVVRSVTYILNEADVGVAIDKAIAQGRIDLAAPGPFEVLVNDMKALDHPKHHHHVSRGKLL